MQLYCKLLDPDEMRGGTSGKVLNVRHVAN